MWGAMRETSHLLQAALAALARLDLGLFHAINGWCGLSPLDYAAWFAQGDDLIKGGILMAAYWWLWFAPASRYDNRPKIMAALFGALLSLLIARALAWSLPFRIRPMYATGIDYHPPVIRGFGGIYGLNMEDWSSFPSDQAAIFFGLAYGLWSISRQLGIWVMIFVAIWVGLVRIYIGFHYPSDVIAGGVIGVVCVYMTGLLVGRTASSKILAFEARLPQVFYACMFFVTFQIAILFRDARKLGRGLLLILHAQGIETLHFMLVLIVGAGVLSALGFIALLADSHRKR